jgi:hypothetical protein
MQIECDAAVHFGLILFCGECKNGVKQGFTAVNNLRQNRRVDRKPFKIVG